MAISLQFKLFLMGAVLLTGTLNTITYKFQNTTIVKEKYFPGGQHTFFHPYMQAVAMFIGETFCLAIYFIWRHRNNKDYQAQTQQALADNLQLNPSYAKYLLPAGADFITSSLQHIALCFIDASVWQMFRGGGLVITAIFSVIFLKKKLKPNNWMGCAIVIAGISVVGVAEFCFGGSSTQYSSSTQVVSIILLIISLFSDSTRLVSEEFLFRKYYIHPYQLVGLEGCWGITIFAVVLPILTFAPCNINGDFCVYAPNGTKHFERPDSYFIEATSGAFLGIMCILGVVSILFFNMSGVTLTKNISCLVRSLVDITRTIAVWVVGLSITWSHWRDWENTKLNSILCELGGFIILIIGNLTYSAIIKWPFLKYPEDKPEQPLIKEQLIDPDEKTHQDISAVSE